MKAIFIILNYIQLTNLLREPEKLGKRARGNMKQLC
jgi:hypothetical protein